MSRDPTCGACAAGAMATGSSSRIERIRAVYPDAALRSSFIVGYPGETEEDHDQLLAFLEAADLDWAGSSLFPRRRAPTPSGLPDQVAPALAAERLAECAELQDAITARRRRAADRAAAFGSSSTSRALARSHRGGARDRRRDPGAGRRRGRRLGRT